MMCPIILVVLFWVRIVLSQDTYKVSVQIEGHLKAVYADQQIMIKGSDEKLSSSYEINIPMKTKCLAFATHYKGPTMWPSQWPSDKGAALTVTSPYLWSSLGQFTWRCISLREPLTDLSWTSLTEDQLRIGDHFWGRAERTVNSALLGTYDIPGWREGGYIWPYVHNNFYEYAYCRGYPGFKVFVTVDGGTFDLYGDGQLIHSSTEPNKTAHIALPVGVQVIGIRANTTKNISKGLLMLGKWLWTTAGSGWRCISASKTFKKEWSMAGFTVEGSGFGLPYTSPLFSSIPEAVHYGMFAERRTFTNLDGDWIWTQNTLTNQSNGNIFCRIDTNATIQISVETKNDFTVYIDEAVFLKRVYNVDFNPIYEFYVPFTTRLVAIEISLQQFHRSVELLASNIGDRHIIWRCTQDKVTDSSWLKETFNDIGWRQENTAKSTLSKDVPDNASNTDDKYYCRGYLSLPLEITVDGLFTLYADGRPVWTAGSFGKPYRVLTNVWHKPAVPATTSVIALQALSYGGGGAIGIVGSHIWTSVELFNWRCTDQVRAGENKWPTLNYHDENWPRAFTARHPDLLSPSLPGNRKAGSYIWTENFRLNQTVYCRGYMEIDECREQELCNEGKCVNTMGSYYCDCAGTGYFGTNCEIKKDEFVIYGSAYTNYILYADGQEVLRGGPAWNSTVLDASTQVLAVMAEVNSKFHDFSTGIRGFAFVSYYIWTGFPRFDWKCIYGKDVFAEDWKQISYNDSGWVGLSLKNTPVNNMPLGYNDTNGLHATYLWVRPSSIFVHIHCRAYLHFDLKIKVHDEFELYADGTLVAQGGNHTKWYDVTMRRRTMVVGVMAKKHGGNGGIALSSKHVWSTATRMGWRCSDKLHENWHGIYFNDSSWDKAVETNAFEESIPLKMPQQGWIWGNVSDNVNTIYCRTRLDFNVSVRVRNIASIYAKGQQVMQKLWWSGAGAQEINLGMMQLPYSTSLVTAHLRNTESFGEFLLESEQIWTSSARFSWKCIPFKSISVIDYAFMKWTHEDYDDSFWHGASIPSCYVDDRGETGDNELAPIWLDRMKPYDLVLCRGVIDVVPFWGILFMSPKYLYYKENLRLGEKIATQLEKLIERSCTESEDLSNCTAYVRSEPLRKVYHGNVLPAYFTITFRHFDIVEGKVPDIEKISQAIENHLNFSSDMESHHLVLEKFQVDSGYLPECKKLNPDTDFGAIGNCYYIIDQNKQTFLEAVYTCNLLGGQLYMPRSPRELNKLKVYLSREYSTPASRMFVNGTYEPESAFWIGAREIRYRSWTWNDYPIWSETWWEILPYSNWEKNLRPSVKRPETCVVLVSETLRWRAVDCHTMMRGYICEQHIPGLGPRQCQDKVESYLEPILYTKYYKGKCYQVDVIWSEGQNVNYFQARQLCETNKSAELLKIHNAKEQFLLKEFLLEKRRERLQDPVWIGLHASDIQSIEWEGAFKQPDGEEDLRKLAISHDNNEMWLKYNTEHDQPGCISLAYRYYSSYFVNVWAIDNCTAERPFVCEVVDHPANVSKSGEFPEAVFQFRDLYDFDYDYHEVSDTFYWDNTIYDPEGYDNYDYYYYNHGYYYEYDDDYDDDYSGYYYDDELLSAGNDEDGDKDYDDLKNGLLIGALSAGIAAVIIGTVLFVLYEYTNVCRKSAVGEETARGGEHGGGEGKGEGRREGDQWETSLDHGGEAVPSARPRDLQDEEREDVRGDPAVEKKDDQVPNRAKRIEDGAKTADLSGPANQNSQKKAPGNVEDVEPGLVDNIQVPSRSLEPASSVAADGENFELQIISSKESEGSKTGVFVPEPEPEN